FGGRAHSLLIPRRERAQRMLDPVTQLPQHFVRNIVRRLRTEVDPDALGANDSDHLLHTLQERGRRIIEQQVCLVEDEHQLGLLQIPHLGQVLEQLGKQPQQEAGIQLRLHDQLIRRQDADDATAAEVRTHQVAQLQRRLAKQTVSALALQRQQGALDGADGLRTDQAILAGNLLAIVRQKAEQRPQVVQIEQEEALVIRQLEGNLQHPGLGVVELENAAQQA